MGACLKSGKVAKMVRNSGGTELANEGLGLRSVSGSGDGLGLGLARGSGISLMVSFSCSMVSSLPLCFPPVPLLSVVSLPSIRSWLGVPFLDSFLASCTSSTSGTWSDLNSKEVVRSTSSVGFDFFRGLSSYDGRHLELTSKESGSGVDGVNWLPNRCSRILQKRRNDVAVTGEEWNAAGVWRRSWKPTSSDAVCRKSGEQTRFVQWDQGEKR